MSSKFGPKKPTRDVAYAGHVHVRGAMGNHGSQWHIIRRWAAPNAHYNAVDIQAPSTYVSTHSDRNHDWLARRVRVIDVRGAASSYVLPCLSATCSLSMPNAGLARSNYLIPTAIYEVVAVPQAVL